MRRFCPVGPTAEMTRTSEGKSSSDRSIGVIGGPSALLRTMSCACIFITARFVPLCLTHRTKAAVCGSCSSLLLFTLVCEESCDTCRIRPHIPPGISSCASATSSPSHFAHPDSSRASKTSLTVAQRRESRVAFDVQNQHTEDVRRGTSSSGCRVRNRMSRVESSCMREDEILVDLSPRGWV